MERTLDDDQIGSRIARGSAVTRIGIVGAASFYGPHYASIVSRRSDTTVAGIAVDADDDELRSLERPTRDELRDRYDCALYDSVEELLTEATVDGVVIASRTTQRADDAVTALDRGVPVLTAKPAAASSEGARRIAAAAGAGVDIPALTTSPARYDRAIDELQTRVENGEIGDVLAIDATIRHDRVPVAGIDHNAEHASDQAGSVLAMGYYTADLLEWLGGSVTHIGGELTNLNTPHAIHPDLGVATARLEGGAVATMRMQYATDCREPLGNWEVEVVGSDGIVRTAQQGYEGVHWSGGSPESRTVETFGRVQNPVLDAQFDAFVDAIETETLPAGSPNPESVVSALEICEAWRRGAETGETVFLDR